MASRSRLPAQPPLRISGQEGESGTSSRQNLQSQKAKRPGAGGTFCFLMQAGGRLVQGLARPNERKGRATRILPASIVCIFPQISTQKAARYERRGWPSHPLGCGRREIRNLAPPVQHIPRTWPLPLQFELY